MTYHQMIAAIEPDANARHVEAFMRLQYSTLDHLSAAVFRREVRIAHECSQADPEMAERLARSYGL
jgi:hypothetical protein